MSELTFVKYCPLCGAENPRQQAFCMSCLDGDLSTVAVEPRRAPQQTAPPAFTVPAADPTATASSDTLKVRSVARLELEVIDNPGLRFTVREGQTIGRTAKADVVLHGVPKLEWVSSAHARFFRRGEQWYVQHIAQTNFIKVDGEMYHGHEEVALYDGSILVLSLTAFRISIGGG